MKRLTQTGRISRNSPILLNVACLIVALAVEARAGQVGGDFNGDGFTDLAVGIPGEDLWDFANNNLQNAGAVSIIYGSPTGLSAIYVRNQLWGQDSAGVFDNGEAQDGFGSSLAAGDFNGDGYDDLAIGVPGEDVGTILDAGAVSVLYGSPTGLTSVGNQIWHQNSTDIKGTSAARDRFGWSLATGDFDRDGYDDLAVGIPDKDIDGIPNAGAVTVLYGSPSGVSARDEYWHGRSIQHLTGSGSQFGFALATLDISADGFDDLTVGVPHYANSLGTAFLLRGWSGGLKVPVTQFEPLGRRPGEQCGSALASGDFDENGLDDLALGCPGSDLGVPDVGAVRVLYVVTTQVTEQRQYNFTNFRAGDAFGSALAAGDFNRDGADDLAIGMPTRDAGGVIDAGAVTVLYGSSDKLVTATGQVWHQSTTNIVDAAEAFDRFGSSLAVGDFDGDGRDDLAIGVPGEDLFNPLVFPARAIDAGAVNVIYSAPTGRLAAGGNQIWHQDSAFLQDGAEPGDAFGAAVK